MGILCYEFLYEVPPFEAREFCPQDTHKEWICVWHTVLIELVTNTLQKHCFCPQHTTPS